MSYFKLRPLIRKYKEEMLKKYGIKIYKVKWAKEQLDLMMDVVEKPERSELVREFDDCHYFKIDKINILDI